jgi:hypothetical protein
LRICNRPEAQHRKKYIKMLRAMEEEAKRAKEDSEKKLLQQQQQVAKLRAKMGVDNVAPRLFEPLRRGLAEGEEEEEGGKKKPALPAEEEDDNDDDPEKLAAKKARPRDVQQLRLAPFFLAPGARKGKSLLYSFFFLLPCSLHPSPRGRTRGITSRRRNWIWGRKCAGAPCERPPFDCGSSVSCAGARG